VEYVLGDGTSCLHRVVVTLELASSKLGRLDRSSEELFEDTEESDFSFAVDGINPHCSGLLIGDEVESAVLVNRMGMERSLVIDSDLLKRLIDTFGRLESRVSPHVSLLTTDAEPQRAVLDLVVGEASADEHMTLEGLLDIALAHMAEAKMK
jgi:hypothetical protein